MARLKAFLGIALAVSLLALEVSAEPITSLQDANLPLTGNELLPIVQSGACNLTAGTCKTKIQSFIQAGTPGDVAFYTAPSQIGPSAGIILSNSAILTYVPTVKSVSAASCTLGTGVGGCAGLATGDCGTFLSFTNAGSITVTLPNTLPLGCEVAIEQDGAGQVTIAAAGGATLHTAHSFAGKTFGQYSTVGLVVTANSSGTAAVAVMTGDGA